jgi:hypothetical protein
MEFQFGHNFALILVNLKPTFDNLQNRTKGIGNMACIRLYGPIYSDTPDVAMTFPKTAQSRHEADRHVFPQSQGLCKEKAN